MLGFINVDKPSGITSNDVVHKIKKKFNLNKVGHMGTLDPMASGILPIAIGKATRMFDFFLEKKKKYIAEFKLGLLTDTLDITGKIITQENVIIKKEDLLVEINNFPKSYEQMPPKFSAKKINGKKAYQLARNNVDFELQPKKIEIYKLNLVEFNDEYFKLEIECSSGTYVRSLGEDIAKTLNTHATMLDLKRIESGVFNLGNSVSLEKLLSENSIDKYLLKVEEIFPSIEKLSITQTQLTDLINGKNVEIENELKERKFLICNNQLVGLSNFKSKFLKIDVYLYEGEYNG